MHAPRTGWLTVAAATAVVVAAAGLLWMQHPSPAAQSPSTTPSLITGRVVTEGGADALGGSDIRPTYAPIYVRGTTASGKPLSRVLPSGRWGRFSLTLPPGVYTLTARMFGPPSRPLSRQPHERIRVRGGRPIHLELKGYVL